MRRTEPGQQNGAGADWRAADTWLWCYLFLPVPIFLLGFFRPLAGLPAALVALVAAYRWLPSRRDMVPYSIRARRQILLSVGLLGAVAALWAALGGAGHMFYANRLDWGARFAVLCDLVVQDWPPRYIDSNGHELLLRAPLGYYLPPALLARGFGPGWADPILLLWTWIGVALFLIANLRGSLLQKLVGSLLFASASGLDVVGILHESGSLPWVGGHIEWWAGSVQYSSNTTLLFWVPNHALPGWIAAAWLWRLRDDGWFLAGLPILFLPVMLWSPLPALGLLPLAFVASWNHWRRSGWYWVWSAKALALIVLPACLISGYLTMNALAIGGGLNGPTPLGSGTGVGADAGFAVDKIFLFFVLEAGLFGLLALRRDASPLMLTSLIVLAFLPWLRFGPGNDLAMRGSIPALAMLWLTLIAELTAAPGQRRLSVPLRTALVVLWLCGMVTPFQEVYRALTRRPWAPDVTLSTPQALRGFPPHYFAQKNQGYFARLIRN